MRAGAWVAFACVIALSSDVIAQDKLTIVFNGKQYNLIEKGAVDKDSLWTFEDGKPKILHVCWENPEAATKEQREGVQTAIDKSWGAASQVKFLGWGKCATDSPGIRILIKDDENDGPAVLAFGREINGLKNGMILNFTFKNWIPACQKGSKDVWAQRTAVHEFGHALGFRHEQDRDDTTGRDMEGRDCRLLRTGRDPDWHLTTYDAKSIMNYCYCAGNSDLSEFDKIAVQKLYGPPFK